LADQVIVISSGELTDSGPRDEVLMRLREKAAASKAAQSGSTQSQNANVKTIPV